MTTDKSSTVKLYCLETDTRTGVLTERFENPVELIRLAIFCQRIGVEFTLTTEEVANEL